MGVNMPDNESEGKVFDKSLSFSKSNRRDDDSPQNEPMKSDGSWEAYSKYITPDPQKAKIEKARVERPSKTEYYLGIAEAVSKRSTCLRIRYGSVIVKNDRIISTGYNGAPKDRPNCCDLGECYRKKHNIQHMTRYETCSSVHSEMNAIIAGTFHEMNGATLYLCGIDVDNDEYVEADCCMMCRRAIINAGIINVVFRTANGGIKKIKTSEWDNNVNY